MPLSKYNVSSRRESSLVSILPLLILAMIFMHSSDAFQISSSRGAKVLVHQRSANGFNKILSSRSFCTSIAASSSTVVVEKDDSMELESTTSSSSSPSIKKKKTSPPPQVVELIEPKTNVKVVLIGTMHYNPTSIAMVERTIEEYGSRNELGSVLVESCDVRWNTTSDLLTTTRGKILRPVLTSEMKVACDVAMRYDRPVVLGDQRIDATGESLKNVLRQTLMDLANPFFGGWKRFYNEFKTAADVALPSNGADKDGNVKGDYEYLDARSILDPMLLIAAPVSFAKYPLSFLARNPISTMVVFAILGGLGLADDSITNGGTSFADATFEEQISSIVSSLLFAGFEFAIFGRILLQVLLAERNEIIAKNIIDQCKIYSRKSTAAADGASRPTLDFAWISSIIGGNQESNVNETNDSKGSTRETIYVPGSIIMDADSKPQTLNLNDGKEEKVVLCVLGMAHCNGIVNLLKNELLNE